MALKGFLASGFQKLIGASRIKGANEKYLGEFNPQTVTTASFPLAATIHDGFNFVRYTGTSNISYTSGSLFSTIPTSEAVVVLYNGATGSANTITLDTDVSVGGLVLAGGKNIMRLGQSITLIYDTTNSRWREISRAPHGVAVQDATVSASGGLDLFTENKDLLVTVSRSGSSDIVLTGMQGYYTSPINLGVRVTIQGAYDLDMTYSVTFEQFTGTVSPTSSTKFLINGDFVLTRNSTLTLIQTEAGCVEISRSTPTY